MNNKARLHTMFTTPGGRCLLDTFSCTMFALTAAFTPLAFLPAISDKGVRTSFMCVFFGEHHLSFVSLSSVYY